MDASVYPEAAIGIARERDPAFVPSRLSFLRYAISLGEGHRILSQILFDLEDHLCELIDPENDPYSPYLFPEEERRRTARLRFLAVVEDCLKETGRGRARSPSEIADRLECCISEAGADFEPHPASARRSAA
jgi:hypothetical protein